MSPDHYERLGVRRDAGDEEIRDAYRRQAKAHHPDSSGGGDEAEFRDVQEAYETLRDPERRRRYDECLRACARGPAFRAEPARPPVEETAAPRSSWTLWTSAVPVRGRRLELVLDPEEARRGGILPLRLPFEEPCPSCAGSVFARFFCPECGGRGSTASSVEVELRLPGGVRHGSTLAFRVDLDALRSLDVLLDVLVEPA